MVLSNKTYDGLMLLAQVILPGLGTAYAALSGIWGLPATEQVLGTIAAVDTFLGGVLKVLSSKYTPETAGHIVVDDSGPKKIYNIVPKEDWDSLVAGKKSVTMSVGAGDAQPAAPPAA